MDFPADGRPVSQTVAPRTRAGIGIDHHTFHSGRHHVMSRTPRPRRRRCPNRVHEMFSRFACDVKKCLPHLTPPLMSTRRRHCRYAVVRAGRAAAAELPFVLRRTEPVIAWRCDPAGSTGIRRVGYDRLAICTGSRTGRRRPSCLPGRRAHLDTGGPRRGCGLDVPESRAAPFGAGGPWPTAGPEPLTCAYEGNRPAKRTIVPMWSHMRWWPGNAFTAHLQVVAPMRRVRLLAVN